MSRLALALLLLGPPEEVAPERPATPSASIESPRPGTGRLVGGLLAMPLGTVTLFLTVRGIDPKDLQPHPREVTTTLATLGFVSLASGIVLVISGSKARGKFDTWRTSTGAVPRKDGSGLIVGGAMGTVFGSATVVTCSVVAARYPNALNCHPALVAISAVGTAAGIGFLSWGLVRNRRYRSWHESTVIGSSIPVLVPMRRGVGFGIAGRF